MMRCHAAEFSIVQDYAHAREVVRGDRRPWYPHIDAVDQRQIYVGHNRASDDAHAHLGVPKDGFQRKAHQPQSADQ